MSLLTEIERGATKQSTPLSDLLRSCKVLAKRLRHEPLAEWVEKELNGYSSTDQLPGYRAQHHAEVKGNLNGPFGSAVRNAPIPSLAIEKRDRDILFMVDYREGVAHYEGLLRSAESTFGVPWPANFVALYQSRLMEGYVLAEARMIIPRTTIEGLLDQVRNRILSFALEIADENPDAGEAKEGKEPPIPTPKVDQIYNTYIWGGGNVIASGNENIITDFRQSAQDWDSLEQALHRLGLGEPDISSLSEAIDKDREQEEVPGPAVQSWLGGITSRIAMGSLSLANSAAGSMVGAVVFEYLRRL